MSKPNCYACKHRASIPGDAHSRCLHPAIGPQPDNPFAALAAMLTGTIGGVAELGIKGHPTGVSRGWFYWPVNFDPTWLLACNGFEPKETPHETRSTDRRERQAG